MDGTCEAGSKYGSWFQVPALTSLSDGPLSNNLVLPEQALKQVFKHNKDREGETLWG